MMDTSDSWNMHSEQSLSLTGQDDFQQYLDMNMNNLGNGINFDFQDFANQHNERTIHPDLGDAMDTTMEGVNIGIIVGKENIISDDLMGMQMSTTAPLMTHAPVDIAQATNNNLLDLDAQIQYLQQQRHQQHMQVVEQQRQQRQQQQQQQQHTFYAQQRMVPPTPNSIEMHGNSGNQYYGQTDSQMYGRYQLRLKDQELAFTPLVSPAVTPLETHFNMAEYAIPGAYFSPLSSPALHAQQEHQRYNMSIDNSSTMTSPIDLDIDLNAQPPSTGPTPQKPSKKAAVKSKTRSVRQSPIVKPQRRKAGSSTVISPQALSDILEPASQSQNSKTVASVVAQQSKSPVSSSKPATSTIGHISEADQSVSPEHLTEMAPPPIPKTKNSPFMVGQHPHSSRVQQLGQAGLSPATPASLMRLSKSQRTSPTNSRDTADQIIEDHAMEDFALPEPANPFPASPTRDVRSSGSGVDTISGIQSQGSAIPASLSRPQSAKSSPSLRPQMSDAALKSKTTPLLRSTPKLAVRASGSGPSSAGPSTKKRASMSSNILISPALRPKLSPSIGPLNRASNFTTHNITDDTASQLLAVKSNYQNILEGTHLPGVSYPSELSTNLTSKRTSHKIAEQGRRNRINSALAEMATLLPRKSGKDITPVRDPSAEDGEEGSEKGGKGQKGDKDKDKDKDFKNAQSSNSKASTVEHAIEYIRQLQKEVEEATKRAELAERKLANQT